MRYITPKKTSYEESFLEERLLVGDDNNLQRIKITNIENRTLGRVCIISEKNLNATELNKLNLLSKFANFKYTRYKKLQEFDTFDEVIEQFDHFKLILDYVPNKYMPIDFALPEVPRDCFRDYYCTVFYKKLACPHVDSNNLIHLNHENKFVHFTGYVKNRLHNTVIILPKYFTHYSKHLAYAEIGNVKVIYVTKHNIIAGPSYRKRLLFQKMKENNIELTDYIANMNFLDIQESDGGVYGERCCEILFFGSLPLSKFWVSQYI